MIIINQEYFRRMFGGYLHDLRTARRACKLKSKRCRRKVWNMAFSAKVPSVCEFFFDRFANYFSALLSGVLLATCFRFLGEWPSGASDFVQSNYGAVSLTRDNYPSHAAVIMLILAAAFWAPLARVVLIIWDGLVFAVITFTAISAALLIYSGVYPWQNEGPWSEISYVLFTGFFIYCLVIPKILYLSLLKRKTGRIAIIIVGVGVLLFLMKLVFFQ